MASLDQEGEDSARTKEKVLAVEATSSKVNNFLTNLNDDEEVNFCVSDVRKRLKDHSHVPRKLFSRDPEDPSGEYLVIVVIAFHFASYCPSICYEGAMGSESEKSKGSFAIWAPS